MDVSLETSLLKSGLLNSLKCNGNKYYNSLNSKNLIIVFNRQLYAWNDKGVILSVDLSSSSCVSTHKELVPTITPVFNVECMLMNCMGNLLALTGSKGIMVVKIPWVVESFGSHSADNNYLFCRSWTIADKLLSYTGRVELLHAEWYPDPKNNTYLMSLCSDNFLRLYNAVDSPVPLQTISLGQNPRVSYNSAGLSTILSSCLGETAISFDFGLPENTSTNVEELEVIYPIFVLYGDGDVSVVKMNIAESGAHSARVSSPLTMYPAAEDNYGVDASSILCLHSTPPVLVLAMSSGVIYHCLILEKDSEENPWMLKKLNEVDVALYVHGSVQLPVFITSEDNIYNQPIRLYRDITSTNKYHCSMVNGVHTVVLPFIERVEEYSLRGDKLSDNEENLYQLLENDCVIDHVLCTQPLNSIKPIPVIGLSFILQNNAVSLICLLASWEIKCVSYLSTFPSCMPSLLSLETDLAVQKKGVNNQQESFEDSIRQIFCRTTGTPILKSAVTEKDHVSPKLLLDLVQNTTHHFETEYIHKFYAAQAQISKRSKVLSQCKQDQIKQLSKLMKNKEELQNNMQCLTEKYNVVFRKQQELYQRIHAVYRKSEQDILNPSIAEIKMKNELQDISEKLKPFQNSIDQLKKKFNHCKQEMEKIDNHNTSGVEDVTAQLSNMNLGGTQLKYIVKLLTEEGYSIKQLMHRVCALKEKTATLN